MSLEAIRKAQDEQRAAFEDFKAANDRRIEALEATGTVSPEIAAAVDKANAEITALTAKIEELTADHRARLDAIEAANNAERMLGGGRPGETVADDRVVAEAFNRVRASVQGERARPVDADAIAAYREALNVYRRGGPDGLTPDLRDALSIGSDPSGGYLVLPDSTGRIVELVRETSPMREVADVQTIGRAELEGLYDLDEGGAGWVGERSSRPETDTPEVGEWSIPVHEVYAEPKATQNMLDDSMWNIEAWLERKVADRIARMENTGFVTGDGVKRPRGFLTYAAGVPDSDDFQKIEQKNTGHATGFASSNPGDALIDVAHALKANYRANARWAMNRLTVAEVRKLKDGQGNYLWQPNFTLNAAGLIAGYPLIEFDDMPVMAANSLSVAIADWREAYTIVDRQGIRMLRDPYTAKGYVKFYTTKRTGGGVINFDAIKVLKTAA